MKKRKNRLLLRGAVRLGLFLLCTVLVQTVDLQSVPATGTTVGFATVNLPFHALTGVHMGLYTLTDWLGLVPVAVCLLFALLGLSQLIKRRKLREVDPDLILLGFYYLLVAAAYLLFELYPINYRPVLMDGRLEASYPSSTTLLVLGVMPTLDLQCRRRVKNTAVKNTVRCLTGLFSLFFVMGRLVSGVHWLTDIAAALLLSGGLFDLYRALVNDCGKEESREGL